MITLIAPDDAAVFRRITLSSGHTVRPRFSEHATTVIVAAEADAVELEAEGWTRVKYTRRFMP